MSAGPDPQRPTGSRGDDLPQGSALFKGVAIILVFLVAGFFLVKSLGSTTPSSTTATTTPIAAAPPPTTPQTAPPPSAKPQTRKSSEVKVLFVNATTTAGATKPVVDALKPACYAATTPAVYDAAKKDNPAKSKVYFIPNYEAEGKLVASQLGLGDQDVAQYPTNERVVAAGGPAFNVLVVVGKDWVTKPPAKAPSSGNCESESGVTTTTTKAGGVGSTSSTKKATGSTTTPKKKA